MGDTVIGEGARIDNLVRIASDMMVDRHCVIVAGRRPLNGATNRLIGARRWTNGDQGRSGDDCASILKMLPHRYPFLMVDRVIDIRGDEFGIGIKNVTINEPQFQGHFPDNPVFPGVLLLEGMAQTAGVLCVLACEGARRRLTSIS